MADAELEVKTTQEVVKPRLLKHAECTICSEIGLNEEELVCHMSKVHKIKAADRPYQCSTCDFSFRNRLNLWRHKKLHIQLPHTFQCQHCPKAYQSKAGLSIHMRMHKEEKPYSCQLCSYKSRQLSKLKSHMIKHEVAQFKCNDCEKVYQQKETLIKHINDEHLGKKVFPCPFCHKSYSCRQTMKNHVKIHTGEDINEECTVCHKMYRRLRDHMIMHKEKLFECNICHKKFRRAPELKLHMRVHTGEKPYECKFCSKRFRQHAHYMAHLKSHTSEKGHHCSICNHSFSNLDTKKVHMQKHDGTFVRKYTCTICCKDFESNRNLRVHSAIHEEREEIECKECGKKLATKASLKQHMAKHIGIRFKCTFCEQEYYRADKYKKHVRTHSDTDILVYPCKDCGKEFESVRNYKKHVMCCKI